MAQHDMDVSNQTFTATRADINAALQALASNSSGATAPATTFAYQWWADTTSGILKQRNAANSAWVNVLNLATGVPTGAAASGANGDITSLTALTAGGLPDNSVLTADIANAAITAAKLSGAQTGSAPIYGARAWCVFDGTLTGTNAPTSGGNVSSVTRNGVGDYTVTFTTAIPDGLYSVVASTGAGGNGVSAHLKSTATALAGSVSLTVRNQVSNAIQDDGRISIAIFR
jgi:hypothetical protein